MAEPFSHFGDSSDEDPGTTFDDTLELSPLEEKNKHKEKYVIFYDASDPQAKRFRIPPHVKHAMQISECEIMTYVGNFPMVTKIKNNEFVLGKPGQKCWKRIYRREEGDIFIDLDNATIQFQDWDSTEPVVTIRFPGGQVVPCERFEIVFWVVTADDIHDKIRLVSDKPVWKYRIIGYGDPRDSWSPIDEYRDDPFEKLAYEERNVEITFEDDEKVIVSSRDLRPD